jgi:hypothetical protein
MPWLRTQRRRSGALGHDGGTREGGGLATHHCPGLSKAQYMTLINIKLFIFMPGAYRPFLLGRKSGLTISRIALKLL